MQATLNTLAEHQQTCGQFPTFMVNQEEGRTRQVFTITSTYLICLFLSKLRESTASNQILDRIIERGLRYLWDQKHYDPVGKTVSWSINPYYPPDWEQTCWISLMLYRAEFISRGQLEPTKQLLLGNETEDKGVGVWVRDDFSQQNKYRNTFDPVNSLAVTQFLEQIWHETSLPTSRFLEYCRQNHVPSRYYFDQVSDVFYNLLGQRQPDYVLAKRPDHLLFHNGCRKQVCYGSADVWETISLCLG